MYALHEAGLAVSTPPAAGPVNPPPGQVDQRAVESTESGSLETNDRRNVVCTSTGAVLQLVRDSAENYTELVSPADVPEGQGTTSGAYLGDGVGQELDLYA